MFSFNAMICLRLRNYASKLATFKLDNECLARVFLFLQYKEVKLQHELGRKHMCTHVDNLELAKSVTHK